MIPRVLIDTADIYANAESETILGRIIAPRRDAQTIYYGIVDPAAARVIALLCDIYRDKPKDKTS